VFKTRETLPVREKGLKWEKRDRSFLRRVLWYETGGGGVDGKMIKG